MDLLSPQGSKRAQIAEANKAELEAKRAATEAAKAAKRDPSLPTSTVLPMHEQEIMDPGMRAMWMQHQARPRDSGPVQEVE